MPLATDELIIVRGGGDIASGVVWRLHHAGFRVLVTELPTPLSIRRTVSLSTAVTDGWVEVEGLVARRCEDNAAITRCWTASEIPVVVAPTLAEIVLNEKYFAVVDSRLAKQPLDTTTDDAPIVIGLGPGFIVGEHCHAVVETMRGHRLGRVLLNGSAEPNTGTPGAIEGKSAERVVRADSDGVIDWSSAIGDWVESGSLLGRIQGKDAAEIVAPFTGMVRGLITPGSHVTPGMKIADVDPRNDPTACHQISDKALAIGGGVAEAIFRLSSQR